MQINFVAWTYIYMYELEFCAEKNEYMRKKTLLWVLSHVSVAKETTICMSLEQVPLSGLTLHLCISHWDVNWMQEIRVKQ